MYKKSIITVCLLLFIVFASNTFSIAQDARTLVKAGINTKYLLKKIFKIDADTVIITSTAMMPERYCRQTNIQNVSKRAVFWLIGMSENCVFLEPVQEKDWV